MLLNIFNISILLILKYIYILHIIEYNVNGNILINLNDNYSVLGNDCL